MIMVEKSHHQHLIHAHPKSSSWNIVEAKYKLSQAAVDEVIQVVEDHVVPKAIS